MRLSDAELQGLLSSPETARAYLRQAVRQADNAAPWDRHAKLRLEFAVAVLEATIALEHVRFVHDRLKEDL